jgi:hypothetical protein
MIRLLVDPIGTGCEHSVSDSWSLGSSRGSLRVGSFSDRRRPAGADMLLDQITC